LLIHGGPGANSCSGIPTYSLLGEERPVIFYDQLGSGRSDRPNDTALWTLSRFVDEIDALRNALNLKELHILGHSWGGSILIEYLLTKKPQGIKSAIFCGPLLSTSRWIEDANILLGQLPKNLRDTIKKYEDLKEYNAPAYLAASDSFYARHVSVKQWPPAPVPGCDSVPQLNDQPYHYMWGPTEFTATGTLIKFDRVNRLKEIKQPVLLIAGRNDEARPETMYEFQRLMPKATVVIIENSGHLIMIDQPVAYTTALRNYLHELEAK
jgi:proline iminopeptidase